MDILYKMINENLNSDELKSLLKTVSTDNLALYEKIFYKETLIKKELNTKDAEFKNIAIYTEDMSCMNKLVAELKFKGINVCFYSINDYKNNTHDNFLPDEIIFYCNKNVHTPKYKDTNYIVDYAYDVLSIILNNKNNRYIKYAFIFNGSTDIRFKAFSGMLKTISLELPYFKYKNILLKDNLYDESKLIEEIVYSDYEYTHVVYENNTRMVNYFKEFNEISKNIYNFKDGVFLITGGLGGIGKILTKYLIEKGASKIYLIGRKKIKENLLSSFNNEKSIIKYISCDITERSECDELVADIILNEKALDGIFHCAGILKDGYINTLNKTDFMNNVDVKYNGIINILEALTKYSCMVKFTKIFSSITSVLGNIGQASYALANGLLNTLALYNNKYSIFNIQSICFPLWRDGGMQVGKEKLDALFKKTGQYYLETDAGLAAISELFFSKEKSPVLLYGNHNKINKYLDNVCKNNLESNDLDKVRVKLQTEEINYDITLSDVTDYVKNLIAEVIEIPKEKLKNDVGWYNYGIDSLSIMRINDKFGEIIKNISKTIMYEYKNISELSQFIYEEYRNEIKSEIYSGTTNICESYKTQVKKYIKSDKSSCRLNEDNKITDENCDIAVIGMTGRYPMADNLNEFWKNLISGRDCIEEIPLDRWDYNEDYNKDKTKKGYSNSKWGGFIKDFNCFDAQFFGITPREAKYLDPQERIFLECCYHTLEDADYTIKDIYGSDLGVFVGVMYSHYQLYGTDFKEKGKKKAYNSSYSSIANRVSFYLNTSGPSLAVDTMCSSSLTALHIAINSILNKECKMALCGGVNLSLHPNKYINLSQNNFLSTNGRCLSFGDGGDGYVPSEGVGSVLLKPLKEAEKDGDYIYGIIKAVSLNHGGRANGFTVPNPTAQTSVIKSALKKAKIKPEDYAYIEAHGTGTALGDPIEINSLTKAFGTNINRKCPIGSVKSNIGHCESASGIAGLTKILLQMKEKKLVPSIHCSPLNRNIDFKHVPFYVQDKVESWHHIVVNNEEIPYIAGLNSFGAGGSNAHVIVQEYRGKDIAEKVPVLDYNILTISAKDQESLNSCAKLYISFLKQCKEEGIVSIEHICYAAQCFRDNQNSRLAIVCKDYDEAINKLEMFLSGTVNKDGIFVNGEDCEFLEDNKQSKLLFINCHKIEDVYRICKEYISIKDYDFYVLWGDIKYRKIHLPLYPFKRTKYWIDEIEIPKYNSNNRFLNVSSLKKIQFITNYNSDDLYIKDHEINKEIIIPGAALILNAKNITEVLTEEDINSLKDLVFVSPGKFQNSKLTLKSDVNKEYFKLKMSSSEHILAMANINLHTRFNISEFNIPILQSILKRLNSTYECSKIYKNLQNNHINYGDGLRILSKVKYSKTEALVEFKNYSYETEDEFLRNIPYVDGAFQAIYVFKELIGLKDGETMLPYKAEEINFTKTNCKLKYAYLKYEGSSRFNIYILDENYKVYMEILNFSLMKVQNFSKDKITNSLEEFKKDNLNIDDTIELLERWVNNER